MAAPLLLNGKTLGRQGARQLKSGTAGRRGCQLGVRTLASLAVAILTITAAAQAPRACTVPPQHLTAHHAELVRRANQIALARFEKTTRVLSGGCSGDNPRYKTSFSTIETLKGRVPARFSLEFYNEVPSESSIPQPHRDPPGADFAAHTDWAVWDERATRVGNGADCGMHPRFEVGATYLIFLDTSHWRSFERIDRPDDRWLRAVKTLIATPSAPSGLSMSLSEYLGEQKALFVGEMVGCYLNDPDVPYPNEVKVREVLFGKVPDTVRIRSLIGGPTRCRVGPRVVGVIHSVGGVQPPNDRKPPGRLFPLAGNDTVAFDAEPSEAIITRDGPIALGQLRTLAASRALPKPRR